MRSASLPSVCAVGAVFFLAACPAPTTPPPALAGAALRDPASCQRCHAEAFESWAQSGHANASTSPLFVASLKRAEREADADTVASCLRCHAPLALNATANSLGTLDETERGVTCFVCHAVDSIAALHDGALSRPSVDDAILKGRFSTVHQSAPHALQPSALLDRKQAASSDLCASCHRSETPGAPLEQTGAQHAESLFGDLSTGTSCAGCHVRGSDHAVGDGGSFRNLDHAIAPELCVEAIGGGIEVTVRLENFGAGHRFPAGGSHRKRAWVEVVATLGPTTLFSIGDFDDEATVDVEAQDAPDLWTLHGRLENEAEEAVLFPWEAATVVDNGLVAAAGLSPLDPAYVDVHQVRTYFFVGPTPDRVRLRVRYKNVANNIIEQLIGDGDLVAGEVRPQATALAGSVVEWTPESGRRCVPTERR